MTINGWIQIILYCAIVVALVQPLGGYMTRVFNGERTFLSPVLRPVEVGALPARRRRREARAALADLRGRHAAVQRRRLPAPLRAAAPAGGAAVQPGRACPRSRRTSPSTPRSASSPTPTGRTTAAKARCPISCRWLGLTHAELPLGRDRHRARGRADPRLRARLGADRSAISGSISRAARSTSCCRSASSARCSSSGRACRRRSAPMSTRRRSKAPSRPSRSARSPRRSRSRCSAPMAAASSTPMRRIRSRTRRALELRPDGLDLRASARRSPTCSAAWSATSARAGRSSPPWACCSSPASPSAYWAEARGNDRLDRARASTGGNMEGKEVRFGIAASALFAVDHHGRLLRRGQRHARLLHARSAA